MFKKQIQPVVNWLNQHAEKQYKREIQAILLVVGFCVFIVEDIVEFISTNLHFHINIEFPSNFHFIGFILLILGTFWHKLSTYLADTALGQLIAITISLFAIFHSQLAKNTPLDTHGIEAKLAIYHKEYQVNAKKHLGVLNAIVERINNPLTLPEIVLDSQQFKSIQEQLSELVGQQKTPQHPLADKVITQLLKGNQRFIELIGSMQSDKVEKIRLQSEQNNSVIERQKLDLLHTCVLLTSMNSATQGEVSSAIVKFYFGKLDQKLSALYALEFDQANRNILEIIGTLVGLDKIDEDNFASTQNSSNKVKPTESFTNILTTCGQASKQFANLNFTP